MVQILEHKRLQHEAVGLGLVSPYFMLSDEDMQVLEELRDAQTQEILEEMVAGEVARERLVNSLESVTDEQRK